MVYEGIASAESRMLLGQALPFDKLPDARVYWNTWVALLCTDDLQVQVRETGFGVRTKVNKHLNLDFPYTRYIITKYFWAIVLKTYLFKVTITDLLQL